MTPKDPFLEGTFWDKFWRPIRSRALLFTPESDSKVSFGGRHKVTKRDSRVAKNSVAPVRFCSVTAPCIGRFERFRFLIPTVPL